MTTPAGWYPDPSGVPGKRYFDGARWTQHYNRPPTKPPRAPIGKTLLIIGGIVVLVVLGVGLALLRESPDFAVTDVLGPEPASLNSAVSDGKMTFVVSDVSPATHWVGNPQPRGQWVIATMTVTNTGNEPQSFFAQNQKLTDTNGREYAADTMAAYAMNQDDAMTIDVNPGFCINVKVPFDVPPGTQLDKIELHDSAFSGGATVKLS
jgi:Domain of unknown function (DUF4352)/Protein of unknown function (DUF2510)